MVTLETKVELEHHLISEMTSATASVAENVSFVLWIYITLKPWPSGSSGFWVRTCVLPFTIRQWQLSQTRRARTPQPTQQRSTLWHRTREWIPRFTTYRRSDDTSDPPNRALTHQDQLPKLPIPPLEETCNRYLRALVALQDDKEHETTKAAVHEFLITDGPKLQEILKEYASDKQRCVSNFLLPFFRLLNLQAISKSSGMNPTFPTAIPLS